MTPESLPISSVTRLHPTALGGFADDLDDGAGDAELVHGRASTDPRQLLADQHVDDAPPAENRCAS